MVTREDVKVILAESLNLSVDELGDDTLLEGDSIESLSYVELLLELEDRYKLATSDDELNGVRTIGDLIQLVMNKVNANYGHNSILQET